MPFMMREALKAEGLISCPGGTDCSSVWYHEHRTPFSHFFFYFQQRLDMQILSAEQAVHSPTYGVFTDSVFCSAVSKRKGSHLLNVSFFFLHSKAQGVCQAVC